MVRQLTGNAVAVICIVCETYLRIGIGRRLPWRGQRKAHVQKANDGQTRRENPSHSTALLVHKWQALSRWRRSPDRDRPSERSRRYSSTYRGHDRIIGTGSGIHESQIGWPIGTVVLTTQDGAVGKRDVVRT